MSLITQSIDFQVGNENFTAYLAYQRNLSAPQPGVIVAHEWWGQDDYIRGRVNDLAEQGFVALAVDMYGSGITADNPDQAGQLMTAVIDTKQAIEQRFSAAMDILKQQSQVDPDKILACGYCFGGAVVLNMARAGKPLQAIASFHGLLETDSPIQKNTFKGQILAFTGAEDPMVNTDIVNTFKQEMTTAQVDHELISYPNVVHGFTNPASDMRKEKFSVDALGYNAHADQDSHNKMFDLFKSFLN